MAGLEHRAAAPSQLLDLLVDAVGEEADQGAAEEDAGDGDDERDDPGRPALVAAERAGVERAQHRLPERLGEVGGVAVAHRQPADGGDHGDHEDDGQEDEAEVADHHDRPAAEGVVEPVPQPGHHRRPVRLRPVGRAHGTKACRAGAASSRAGAASPRGGPGSPASGVALCGVYFGRRKRHAGRRWTWIESGPSITAPAGRPPGVPARRRPRHRPCGPRTRT